MRLLVCNYEYPPVGGGAATAAQNMARYWVQTGHEVVVVTSGYAGLPSSEVLEGVQVERVPALRRSLYRSNPLQMAAYMAAALPRCVSLHRRRRFDVCLAFFGIPGGPVALAMQTLFGVPYAVSLRGGDVPGQQAGELSCWHRAASPLLRRVWRGASAVVANSAGLAKRAEAFLPEVDCRVVPNGVDAEAFVPARELNSNKSYTFLCVGRLSQEKGFRPVIRNVSRLNYESSLMVAGDGPLRNALLHLARDCGVADRVAMLGHCDRGDMPGVYANADCLVHFSTDEGMPNVVLEAMACGLPVIASSVAGSEDLVRHGETGILVQPGDEDALGSAMATLAADPERGKHMGRAGREFCVRLHSWESSAGQWLEILQNAANCAASGGVTA